MSGTRASTHNGRAGKKGAYSAKHNDRDFDLKEAPHIDPSLTPNNQNIRLAGDFDVRTNEEYEQAFYEAHFQESLNRKNAGYKDKGKAGQIKTMEQYRRATKSCPEETLYTLGKDVDPKLLWEIYLAHQEWKAKAFPQCQTLTASLHVDEPNAMPHVHERSVWIGHDAQGLEVVGQAKALAEMGVLPPDPDKKYGKHNNAKQTFSRECREHFLALCRERGLEIIEEPLPEEKVGLDLMEYKIQRTQERLDEVHEDLTQAQQELDEAHERAAIELDVAQTAQEMSGAAFQEVQDLEERREALQGDLSTLEVRIQEATGQLHTLSRQLDDRKGDLQALEKALKEKIGEALDRGWTGAGIKERITAMRDADRREQHHALVDAFLQLSSIQPQWEAFLRDQTRGRGIKPKGKDGPEH